MKISKKDFINGLMSYCPSGIHFEVNCPLISFLWHFLNTSHEQHLIDSLSGDNCFDLTYVILMYSTTAQTIAFLANDCGISCNWHGTDVISEDLRNFTTITQHPLITIGHPDENSAITFVYYEDCDFNMWLRATKRFK